MPLDNLDKLVAAFTVGYASGRHITETDEANSAFTSASVNYRAGLLSYDKVKPLNALVLQDAGEQFDTIYNVANDSDFCPTLSWGLSNGGQLPWHDRHRLTSC